MNAQVTTDAAAAYSPTSDKPPITSRIDSVDLVRGIVVVLMAIDHVRVYSGVPAGGQTAGVFFTRWVTHFCAPLFVFLAGTGAFLRLRSRPTEWLSRFLVTRGAMLVVLELTLLRFAWAFHVDYTQFVLAGVIWMLGWCMILLAPMVRMPAARVGWIGVGIIALQQLFGVVGRALPKSVQPFWEFIYSSGFDGDSAIAILYVIVPWIGVMAAGFGFGALLMRDEASRRRLCLRIGLGLTAAFVVIASLLAMRADSDAPLFVRILNQQKYPASQLFLMMTLGPGIAAIAILEHARGWLARAFVTFGRVPMFYYLLHIPLIHVSALAVNAMVNGGMHQEWYVTAPYTSVPEESRWSLGLLYLVFAIDVAILFVACKWYARRKKERPAAWMAYI